MGNKESFKDKVKNLFDGDDTNSNNVIDKVVDQMSSPTVDKKIDDITAEIEKNTKK